MYVHIQLVYMYLVKLCFRLDLALIRDQVTLLTYTCTCTDCGFSCTQQLGIQYHYFTFTSWYTTPLRAHVHHLQKSLLMMRMTQCSWMILPQKTNQVQSTVMYMCM